MQIDEDVPHKDVKYFCYTNQFNALEFSGPHQKPPGVRELGKRYHMRFDAKLGHGTCKIHWIDCACIHFTDMLYRQRTPNIPPQKTTTLPTCYRVYILAYSRCLQQL